MWVSPALHWPLVHNILPFLGADAPVVGVCRTWRAWIQQWREHHHGPTPSFRRLTDTEIEGVVSGLRNLRLPWTEATEQYVTRVLGREDAVAVDEDPAEIFVPWLQSLYQRAVLPPRMNIGTLDTDRVRHPSGRGGHPTPPG